MCVICYKKREQALPSEETIRDMWTRNHDGAGVMWNDDDGLVHFQKGFMTVDSLLKFIRKNNAKLATKEVAMHFRIGTAGGNTPGNTHPFVCDMNVNPHRSEGKFPFVLMHNGIIDIVPRSEDISDTAELALRAGSWTDPEMFLSQVDEFLKGNKVVLFDGKGAHFYGDDWKTGSDGLLYSNLNHEYSTYSWYYGSCTGGTSYGHRLAVEDPSIPWYVVQDINTVDEYDAALDAIALVWSAYMFNGDTAGYNDIRTFNDQHRVEIENAVRDAIADVKAEASKAVADKSKTSTVQSYSMDDADFDYL